MTLPVSIGRYTITGELGRGAMGVVYRAVDPTLDRPIAIKVIAARTAAVPLSGEELEARFVREARMASRISHPGVVIVHDAGRRLRPRPAERPLLRSRRCMSVAREASSA